MKMLAALAFHKPVLMSYLYLLIDTLFRCFA